MHWKYQLQIKFAIVACVSCRADAWDSSADIEQQVAAPQQPATERNPTHQKHGKPTTPRWVKLIEWFTQTSLTAQVHKRARLPSRLKVTLVSGIFRPSTWRLRFLIHTLWNVSYTCHHAILMQGELHSVNVKGTQWNAHASRQACIGHTSGLRFGFSLVLTHWQMANKINAIFAIKKLLITWLILILVRNYVCTMLGTNLINARKV